MLARRARVASRGGQGDSADLGSEVLVNELESDNAPALPPEVTATDRSAAIWQALRGVIDPELGEDLVELGMVKRVDLRPTSTDRSGSLESVLVEVALTSAACPLRHQLGSDIETKLASLAFVGEVEIRTVVMDRAERAALMSRARLSAQRRALATEIPLAARVLGVVSGKGGVGKSSVTVNLGVALALRGLQVGLLDADIWGHSVPRLLAMEGELTSTAKRIVPLEKPCGAGVLRVVSMGFLSSEKEAIMWRGLVLNRAVQHFLEDVTWGELDYLLIDMPPGTGDVQMGLARMMPRLEMLVVTTPPGAAVAVAGRAADMARRGHLRIAGVIENMAGFTCEHGTHYDLFGAGGGLGLAEELGVALLGSIPLDPRLVSGGDAGDPVAFDTSSDLGRLFEALAARIATTTSPRIEMAGCTARLLEAIEASLD